ncbi:MAG: carboxypeptidase regulatory-like domain-containing protein [Nitrososphaerota archaeon]|nr:carboxypeptidase regulatory-like domain-containing protein [Nitrososphaerota archaeon]
MVKVRALKLLPLIVAMLLSATAFISPASIGTSTYAPLDTASVNVVNSLGSNSTSANAQGSYSVDVYQAGSYNISASSYGYLDQSSTVTAVAGSAATSNFNLQRSSIISGTITTATGAPVGGATVNLATAAGVFLQGTTSGSDGKYVFDDNVPAGTYLVNVTTTSFSTLELSNCFSSTFKSNSTFGFAIPTSPVVSPGALPAGMTVTVGAQAATTANFRLAVSGAVSGTVTGPTGAGVGGVILSAYGSAGAGSTTCTDSSGNYEILGVPSGSVTIAVVTGASGLVAAPQSQTATVTLGAVTSGVDFSMTKSGTISGTVTDSTGQPVAGASVSVVGSSGSSAYSGSNTTNAQGHYLIDSGLGAGSYTVYASYGTYPNSIYGYKFGVALTAGGSATADITMTGTAAAQYVTTVSGIVTTSSGTPILGAGVSASTSTGTNYTTTDATGAYSMQVPLGGATDTVNVTSTASGYAQASALISVTSSTPATKDFTLVKLAPLVISGLIQGEVVASLIDPVRLNTWNLEYNGGTYPIATTSSSNIQGIFFFSSSSSNIYGNAASGLVVSVEGPTGTTGNLKVAIPTSLLSGNIVVYLDSNVISYTTVSSNSTFNVYDVSYTHSAHSIVFTNTTPVPEFPGVGTFLALVVAVATLAVIPRMVLRRAWRGAPGATV